MELTSRQHYTIVLPPIEHWRESKVKRPESVITGKLRSASVAVALVVGGGVLVYAFWIVLIRLDILSADTLRIFPYALLGWAAIVALAAALRGTRWKREDPSC